MKTMDHDRLKESLFDVLRRAGAALCGVASLQGVANTDGFPVGVSVAVCLPPEIVRDLRTAPTKAYEQAYYDYNSRLDSIVSAGEAFLQSQGYRAKAMTRDRVKSNEDERTPLPHKTVAVLAGLGWIGKSCLLVTPQYGGAVRISTLLTDAPLPADTPFTQSRCGDCTVCTNACPGNAITGTLWQPGIEREELVSYPACIEGMHRVFEAAIGYPDEMCGRCFAVCPYTQRYIDENQIQ